ICTDHITKVTKSITHSNSTPVSNLKLGLSLALGCTCTRPLHLGQLYSTGLILPLSFLHLLCTHFSHFIHFIEFCLTPFPHTPQGNFPDSSVTSEATLHFNTFVLATFTFSPFSSRPSFHD